MNVCIHVFCMCIGARVCVHANVHTYVSMVFVCVLVYMYVRVHANVYTCVSLFFVCVSVYIYVCMHANMYIYIWRLKADVANHSWSLFYLIN